jgi:hypothetical protein
MKRLLLTFTGLATLTLTYAQNGQIENGGFENWTNQTLADTLDDWDDSNSDQSGPPTLFQSNDAADGNYSAQLTAAAFGPSMQDTTFGYIFHGSVGNNGPDGGISYIDDFDEVQYQYKADLATDDTLYLLVVRYNGGTQIGMDLYPAAFGQVSTWTQGSINVSTATQDELFIGFILGDPFDNFEPSPNSSAWVDDVHMFNGGSATTDLPDPSIENWSSVTVESLDDWYTLNNLLVSSGLPANVQKSTDASSGSFAAELTVLYEPENQDTLSGVISLGEIVTQSMNPFMPFPYEAMPDELSGSYKYAPSNLDVGGGLLVEFYNNGSLLATNYQAFTANASYTSFTLPFNLTSAPDSIILYAFAGNNPGTVLHLDDLSFNGGNVSVAKEFKTQSTLYPNPVEDNLYLRTDKHTNYQIVDIMGNIVETGKTSKLISSFDVSELQKGVYFFNLTQNGAVTTLKFIRK